MLVKGAGALVVGGASGLGEATARLLVAEGAIVTVADCDETRGRAVAQQLGLEFVAMDVTQEASVQTAIAAADAQAQISVVVNCAGVTTLRAPRVVDREGRPYPVEDFLRITDVNLLGSFNVLRLAASAMAARPADVNGSRGVIINTASIAAFDGQVSQVAYAASKGGIVSMTLPAARDLAVHGIRVCTIAPGIFMTPLVAGMTEDQRQKIASAALYPPRPGDPTEFAQLVRSICENDYFNGEVIRLDAGARLGRS
jgi:NAD(P)-dependent dehydrogenase (short-subunit alcohol dehydrogenase family)